jgi:hypothetical protein
MSSDWQFSVKHLLGVVAAFAVSLGLTRFLISTLPSAELAPPAAVCFLFLEAFAAVYVWGLFVCDLFGLSGRHNRWQYFGFAAFILMLLMVSYSMFLPA